MLCQTSMPSFSSEHNKQINKEGIGRSLFCTVKGKEIIILHSFVKKTQKTPKRELERARNRMKEL